MFRYKYNNKSKKEDETEIALPPVQVHSEADTWLSHGLDIENRIIDLTGIVNEAMLAFVLRSLVRLNTISHNPITIYLSSTGGAIWDGFAIYDLIRASPSETIIYASGKICSMGIVVLCAGTHRFSGPNTRFMMHQASSSTEGKIRDVKADLAEVELQDNLTSKLVASRTHLSIKELNAIMDKPDYWFNATMARKFGILTDKPTKKKPKARKTRRK